MEVSNKEHQTKLHIAMFPWFAYGHINPFIHLSNKLSSHGIKISFFSIPGNISRIKSSLNNSHLNEVIPLSMPQVEGLSPNFDSSSDVTTETAELLKVALDKMQPEIKSLLSHLKPDIVCFDFAHYWLPLIASELGMKAIFFSIFSAITNAYLTVPSRMPSTDKQPTIDDLKKPPPGFPKTSITSVRTFEAKDFQYVYKSFDGGPTIFERVVGFIKSCDATIYKTCSEMEGPYIDYLKAQIDKPLFLAGPIVPLPPSGKLEEKWEHWLSKFPEKSVLFCNFGSEVYLSKAEIEELTLGLELTGMPFLLVLKFKKADDMNNAQGLLDISLPKGFKERVKDRGVVHTGWVQQQHILAHKNVGYFLTHSGYSSVIEGIASDCQLIFLPRFGDQFPNCLLFSLELKVGPEVNRRDEDGYFRKEDILEALKTVVDVDREPGKLIRENHNKWTKFLMNKENEDRYVTTLVEQLHDLVSQV